MFVKERFGKTLQDKSKRLFDFAASAGGLAALTPALLVIAAAVKLEDGGPVLYKHKRMGYNFRPFYLYKFRTMTPNADKAGPSVTKRGDSRITKIGAFLRKSKLDELPQLFNVLKGDISIVGPRPEVEEYVFKYRDDYENILSVKPGITDYAAIEYIDEEKLLEGAPPEKVGEIYAKTVLPEKIKYYYKYLNNRSMKTDLELIFKTLYKIVKR